MSKIRRSFSAAAMCAFITSTSAFGVQAAFAQPQARNTTTALSECLASKNTLDIVLLIDESGSLEYLVKDGNIDRSKPGSDVEGHRVTAAQNFVDELVDRQSDADLAVNIKVAGFGQSYKSGATDPKNYGDWTALGRSTVESVKKQIADFKTRTSEDYTNYTNALSGAYSDLTRSGSENPCRMVVTFTDGELTAAEGTDSAKTELCRPSGVTDRLREAGIVNVGIGLSAPNMPNNFELFRSLTEGGNGCGSSTPKGAFFEATNVGGLFAGFREALSTGRDQVQRTTADKPVIFTLDDSINSVRFSALALDELGPNAAVELTTPSGQKIPLNGSGESESDNARITFEASSTPVNKANGRIEVKNGKSWAGEWKIQVTNFDPALAKGQVFTAIELQPDLKLRITNPDENNQSVNGVSTVTINNEQDFLLELVDRDGQIRAMDGEAKTTVHFVPQGGQPQLLADHVDIASGSARIPAAKIDKLPISGELRTTTQVTTAGEPGTAFAPFSDAVPVSVALQNLPKIGGPIIYSAEQESIEVEVPVKGPGRVWLPENTIVETAGPLDSIESISASSQFNSPESALMLRSGEESTLPVTFTVPELADDIVEGTLPIYISTEEGDQETTVATGINASYSIPLKSAQFWGAFFTALLLALLIPLAILYCIRYLTNTIPRSRIGWVKIPVSAGGSITYAGHPSLQILPEIVARTGMEPGGRMMSIGENTLKVRSFSPNPLSPGRVIVQTPHSINGFDGNQYNGSASLPLNVQGQWFLVANERDNNSFDLFVMPRSPLTPNEKSFLEKDIQTKIQSRIAVLQSQLPVEQNTGSTDSDDPFPSGNTYVLGSAGTQNTSPFGSPSAPKNRSPFGPSTNGASNQPFFGDNPQSPTNNTPFG